MTGKTLTVVNVPSFTPLSGVATTVTKISFTSAGPAALEVKDGDVIKMAEASCSNANFVANLATTGPKELAKTATSGGAINTAAAMTARRERRAECSKQHAASKPFSEIRRPAASRRRCQLQGATPR